MSCHPVVLNLPWIAFSLSFAHPLVSSISPFQSLALLNFDWRLYVPNIKGILRRTFACLCHPPSKLQFLLFLQFFSWLYFLSKRDTLFLHSESPLFVLCPTSLLPLLPLSGIFQHSFLDPFPLSSKIHGSTNWLSVTCFWWLVNWLLSIISIWKKKKLTLKEVPLGRWNKRIRLWI